MGPGVVIGQLLTNTRKCLIDRLLPSDATSRPGALMTVVATSVVAAVIPLNKVGAAQEAGWLHQVVYYKGSRVGCIDISCRR